MDRLQAMQSFVRVADAGSFAGAARQLNLSPAAVTRAVAALEIRIGAQLFVRTTRFVKLTEAGARYLEDCRRILAQVAEAEASAGGSHATPTGSLVVTASVLFGQLYVMPILLEYLDHHPSVTGRALFLDRVVHLVEEGIDVAVRIGHLPDSSHAAIRIGQVRRVIVGSPAYLAAHGVPDRPEALKRHRIIAATSAWTSLDWRFGERDKQTTAVVPQLFCNSNRAVLDAALAGWGLTRLLSYHVASDLAEGRLVRVLADHEEEPLPVHVLHAEGRRASAKVRAFVDLVVARLRSNPSLH